MSVDTSVKKRTKLKAASITPPSKKFKQAAVTQQRPISSFFHSPAKSSVNGKEVIVIEDSDSDDYPQSSTQAATAHGGNSDLESAKKCVLQLPEEGQMSSLRYVKEKGEHDLASNSEFFHERLKATPNGTAISSLTEGQGSNDRVHYFFRNTKRIANDELAIPSNITTSASKDLAEKIDFDHDPFTFDPSQIAATSWPKGRLPYSILVGVYVQVSSTKSRLAIIRILTNFLHLLMHTSPPDLTPCLYLLSNHLTPSYIHCDLGIGSSILSKSIQEVSGLQARDLKHLWQKYGDPGDVAFEARSKLRTLVQPAPLLAGEVYDKLLEISRVKGNNSGKIKNELVRKLLIRAKGEEVRFLVRSIIGNLRIGAVRLTLLTALARATTMIRLPADLKQTIIPLPRTTVKVDGNDKRSVITKARPDVARDTAETLCLDAIRIVRKVYVRHPNYGDLVAGLKEGVENLEDKVPVSVGIPLSPMLGSITRSMNEVFTRLGHLSFTAETKLDGQRGQLHIRLDGPEGKDDGGGKWVNADNGTKLWVRLFSRHLEDMTDKYPDISHLALELLSRPLPTERPPFPALSSQPSSRVLDLLNISNVTSVVMDTEIVALDKDNGNFRTFQELSNRGKKDVKMEDIKVVVGVFAFDLMLINDVSLLDLPFSHRRHLLHTLLPPFTPKSNQVGHPVARFTHVEYIDSANLTDPAAELQSFFERVVEKKCEGLMVKLLENGEGLAGEDATEDDLDRERGQEIKSEQKNGGRSKRQPLPATYEPDQRSQGWLKVKKDYLEGLGDSLDLVPIGAWWGQGRKAGWWSPILLACHNPDSGALEAVCKCMSGFSDAFYKDLSKRYPAEGMPSKCSKIAPLGFVNTNGLIPDVWFEPNEVWEIKGADITLSPVYPAASSHLGSERGLSVRFPRFIRMRDDKKWEDAMTSDQLADMYRRQMKESETTMKD
ncbi:DNA ligase 1 [Cryptococcus deuterogattii R265]|uniref:DNA ligase 1 n=1 Tax=Cryptococcus deuterogattii (strain R265) TaxID=294750 RepID=A0A095C753_CRYD2|nr:DNA ligase 1 [Cryptococcus deuterogattii R265]KIR72833.1 DNA ligase 1 [Cryptococcus deuterogattii CA1014]